MSNKIPVYKPTLDGNEKQYVIDCMDSTWISSRGEYIPKFEDAFRDYIGVNHTTAVSNGTVAIHLALATLGIGPGDEVIVPSFTYIASVSNISIVGATPVFVDSFKDTWQINTDDVRRKITPKTKAIMAVHLYGHPCEMDDLVKIARENDIFLIEDCAEAFGSTYRGKHVGGFGDVSTFSFYGNKTVTTGEGGMLATNDETLFNRASLLKMHGLAKYREYWHDIIGFNYRMTNICAAIGLAQLENVEEKLKKKRALAEKYTELLKDLPVTPLGEVGDVVNSYWMYCILMESPTLRNDLRDHLKEDGIETRPTFFPVHTMPMFFHRYQKIPVAEFLGLNGINLPSWPDLSDDEVTFIVDSIKNFFSKT